MRSPQALGIQLKQLGRWLRERRCRKEGHRYPPMNKPGVPGAFLGPQKAASGWADLTKPCVRCGAVVGAKPKAA